MTRLAVVVAITALTGAGLVAAASSAPTREVPVAARVHWRLVFADGFAHGLNRARWGAYSGQPGGDPGGWWDPSHAVVRHGVLDLDTYRDPRFGGRWVSGGVSSSYALKQRYGRYLVRFRMDGGRGVTGVMLLWPVRDHWPPEIDFAETGSTSAARDEISATLHFGRDDETIQRTLHRDFTRWHTLGVEWTPGRLAYTVDGHVWAVVRGRNVPHERMEMDLQAQAGTCGDPFAPCPDATTPPRVRMQIDWVRAYAYRGTSAGR